MMQHMNASVDHIERPLMTPDEVLRLKPPKEGGNGWRNVYRAGPDADLRQRPLPDSRNTDAVLSRPVLRSRAEMPPPAEFIPIENGRAVPQKPMDRTRHRISKPELVAPDTATLTSGERGFLEELQLGPDA